MKIIALALILIFQTTFATSTENSDIVGFHKKIDKLILEKDYVTAEKMAKKAYDEHPNVAEVACALACVYRCQSYKSSVNMNLAAMGLKEGETGTVPIDSKNIDKYMTEKTTIDPEIYKKAEVLYLKILDFDPQYENAYFNLLNDYVVMQDFEKYFKILDR